MAAEGTLGRVLDLAERGVVALERIAAALEQRDRKPEKKRAPAPRTLSDEQAQERAHRLLVRNGRRRAAGSARAPLPDASPGAPVSRPRRAPVFSRLDPEKENRKADRLFEAADRWVKAMGEVTAELTPEAAEGAACAFVRERPEIDLKHAIRTFRRAARIEVVRVERKRAAATV